MGLYLSIYFLLDLLFILLLFLSFFELSLMINLTPAVSISQIVYSLFCLSQSMENGEY